MKKLVINKCFGGFGLSTEAMLRLIALQSAAVKVMTEQEYTGGYERGRAGIETFEPCGNGFEIGWIEDVLYKDGKVYCYQDDIRDDPHLIQVVGELGERASGKYSDLNIVEFPDDVEYIIENYDGSEWIAEKHRTWSG